MSVFVENLVDMVQGALFAPVSDALSNRLKGGTSTPAAPAPAESVPTS
jgi:hypothetical protein